MASWNGNVFHVTAPLCGEFSGHTLHKGQWRRILMFSLFCTRTNGRANTRDVGDLRRRIMASPLWSHAYHDVVAEHVCQKPRLTAKLLSQQRGDLRFYYRELEKAVEQTVNLQWDAMHMALLKYSDIAYTIRKFLSTTWCKMILCHCVDNSNIICY